MTFFERRRPAPYSFQYNLNMQHEVRPNMLVEAGYLANLSHRLTANDLTVNQVHPDLAGPGNAQIRRPYPQFSGVAVINPPIGNSTYHALTIKAERRYTSGFTFLGHYTFAKFIDDVTSFSEYGNVGSYMDAYNRRLDKGISGNDVRHRAVISGVYALPERGRQPPAELRRRRVAHRGDRRFPIRASVHGLQQHQRHEPVPGWFGASGPGGRPPPEFGSALAGAVVGYRARSAAPPPYRFGTAPRSVLRGPGVSNIDLSLTKAFPISERFRTEFRGEFFNLFNHASFNAPGSTRGTRRSASSTRRARHARSNWRCG